jgi:hypothetical protein
MMMTTTLEKGTKVRIKVRKGTLGEIVETVPARVPATATPDLYYLDRDVWWRLGTESADVNPTVVVRLEGAAQPQLLRLQPWMVERADLPA